MFVVTQCVFDHTAPTFCRKKIYKRPNQKLLIEGSIEQPTWQDGWEKMCCTIFLSIFRLFLSFYTWFFSLKCSFSEDGKRLVYEIQHTIDTLILIIQKTLTLKLQLQRTWIKEVKNIWIVGNWDLPLEVQIFNFCSHDCNLSLFFIFCAYLFMVSNPTDCKLDIIMSAVLILCQ